MAKRYGTIIDDERWRRDETCRQINGYGSIPGGNREFATKYGGIPIFLFHGTSEQGRIVELRIGEEGHNRVEYVVGQERLANLVGDKTILRDGARETKRRGGLPWIEDNLLRKIHLKLAR